MRTLIVILVFLPLAACGTAEPDTPTGSLILPARTTMEALVAQEDTDGDRQITVKDAGPRRLELADGASGRHVVLEGTYPLSNLLQELALALDADEETTEIQLERIFEHPLDRISRMIRDVYWDGLTRRIDADGLARIAVDSKAASERPRVYVPATDPAAYAYFSGIAAETPQLNLDVVRLPRAITPEYVRSINDRPGILSLALERSSDGVAGTAFVVPGGRFNEMYGWDSYFESLGLIHDGRVDLARSMVDNFIYEITHYGQILNANRSYYLTRSQPPFLTAMALAVYDALPAGSERDEWLRGAMLTAIREYEQVWTSGARLTPNGLSRYFGGGLGKPPETEAGHYDAVMRPFAEQAGLSVEAFTEGYQSGTIPSPELDAYFVHDRTVRESGHDTSYRLEGRAAHLNTVDLNALLYRYEVDIASVIDEVFGGELVTDRGDRHTSERWLDRADRRHRLVDSLMWNEDDGWFYDYDFVEETQTGFESATAFYPLWSGMASQAQARALVERALPALETTGGVASTSRASTGAIGPDRPQRQWDWPFGWAPHQIMIWEGLSAYGFREDAQRLATRWLTMVATNARDYNGTIPEKYDVVRATHDVFVEYGNVGTDFDYITREGFGWMNASFQVGLAFLDAAWTERLREATDWR